MKKALSSVMHYSCPLGSGNVLIANNMLVVFLKCTNMTNLRLLFERK